MNGCELMKCTDYSNGKCRFIGTCKYRNEDEIDAIAAERDRYKEAFRKILSMSTAGGWIEFTLQKLYPDVLAKIKEG